jgi:hypothetical protein
MRAALLSCLVLMFVGCNDCGIENCQNGECVEQRCLCDEGFLGSECNIQTKPRAIHITAIELENVPEDVLNLEWDDDTTTASAYLPDIHLQVRLGTSQDILFSSSERYFDSKEPDYVFERNMDVKVSDFYPELRITLADLDVPKPEPVYSFNVVGYYTPVGGFPEMIEGTDPNGVVFRISLEYDH